MGLGLGYLSRQGDWRAGVVAHLAPAVAARALALSVGCRVVSLRYSLDAGPGAVGGADPRPGQVKFTHLRPLDAGSYLTELRGREPHPAGSSGSRNATLTVRVIRVELCGFSPYWLATSMLEPTCTPEENRSKTAPDTAQGEHRKCLQQHRAGLLDG